MNKLFKLRWFFVFVTLFTHHAWASKGINFQGVIKDSQGRMPNISGTSVNLKVLAPNGCILREEVFSGVNITDGYVNLVVGYGTLAGSDPGLSFQSIFENSTPRTSLVCVNVDGSLNTSFNSYIPAATDGRKLRLDLTISGDRIIADFNMRSLPFAVNSETLNGKADTSFANINPGQGVTQNNIESIFNRYTKLDSILNNFNAAGNTLSANITGHAATATNVTGTVAIANGGTGATTAAGARTNLGLGPLATLSPGGTGDNTTYLRGDGTWATVTTGGSVSSVAGRTGAVTLTSTDLSDFSTAVDARITGQKGSANGLASLNGSGKVPSSQLALGASDIPSLDASKITSGTLGDSFLAGISVDKIISATAKYFDYKPNNIACALNEILKWDGSKWICAAAVLSESDPKVGANTPNYLSKWNGSALVASGVFENAGNVGIGTASPSFKLHTYTSAVGAGSIVENSTGRFIANIPNNGSGNFNPLVQAGDQSIIYSGGVVDSASSGLVIAPWSAGTKGLRFDANGNVGIGTTSPNEKATIEGVMSLRAVAAPSATVNYGKVYVDSGDSNKLKYMNPAGSVIDLSAGGGGSGDFKADGTVAMSGNFRAAAGAAATPSISFAGDNNTGFYSYAPDFIGVTIGGSGLWGISSTTLGSNSSGGILGYGNTPSSPAFQFGTDNDTGIYNPAVGQIGFVVNASEKIRIDASGKVGIGTTTPSEKLEVAGNIKATQLCIGSDCRGAWPSSGGGGTVTSVGAGTGLTGGPITGTGTLNVDVGTTTGKIVQVAAGNKLPAIDGSDLTNLNAANLSAGTLPSGRLPALTGDVTSAAGSNSITLNTVPISKGGTGQTTATAALNALLPSQGSNSGKVLQTDGTNATWVSPSSGTISALTGDVTASGSGSVAATIANNAVNSAKIADGTVGVADLNFAGVMATNTGILVRDGTQLYSKTCTANQVLIWTVANGWSCSATVLSESDPKVGSNSTNYLSKWNGSALVTSGVYESGGNLGIGTASPGTPLDVRGGLRAANFELINSSTGTPYSDNWIGLATNVDGASNKWLHIGGITDNTDGTGAKRRITYQADVHNFNGNVGIGTTSPTSQLSLRKDSSSNINVGTFSSASPYESSGIALVRANGSMAAPTYPSSGDRLGYFSAAAAITPPATAWSGMEIYSSEAQTGSAQGAQIRFSTVPNGSVVSSTKMVIDQNGNVGIGTTNPAGELQIGTNSATSSMFMVDTSQVHQGSMRVTTDSSANYIQSGLDLTGNSAKDLRFSAYGASTPWMTIGATGNVGIGTTAPVAKLDVAGEVKFGNTSSTCNSTNEGQQRYNSTSKNMEFCNGTAWTAYGTGGSSGRTSCPAGFSLVGTSGSAEAYCISTNEESSATWLSAVTNCSNKSPAARLCSASEWAHACVKAGTYGISGMTTGGWEWVADLSGNSGGVMGNSGCDSFNTNSVSILYGSRCCFR